jgi:putative transposase
MCVGSSTGSRAGSVGRTVVVMPRVVRSLLPDGFFHVTTRGIDGTEIYRDDDDRLRFLAEFATVASTHGWDCHALCLMTNHYHVVVAARVAALSAGMQRLNGEYAASFNQKYGREGHLFGGRFASRVIDSERYLERACRYLVNNPVRAGMCEHAADWRWSACRYGFEG